MRSLSDMRDVVCCPGPKRCVLLKDSWGIPKIRGTFLGVPIIRTLVFWGLYWGPPYLGKLPVSHHLQTGLFAVSAKSEAFGIVNCAFKLAVRNR